MSQLIINLDGQLFSAAKAYAQRQGQQLDALVADWLRATVQPAAPQPVAPTRNLSPRVQRLFGAVNAPADFNYQTALTEALSERYEQ